MGNGLVWTLLHKFLCSIRKQRIFKQMKDSGRSNKSRKYSKYFSRRSNSKWFHVNCNFLPVTVFYEKKNVYSPHKLPSCERQMVSVIFKNLIKCINFYAVFYKGVPPKFKCLGMFSSNTTNFWYYLTRWSHRYIVVRL